MWRAQPQASGPRGGGSMNERAASVPVSPAAGEAKRRARTATTARRVAGVMGVVVLVTFVVAPLAGILSSSVTRSPFWEFPPNGFTLEWYKRFFDDQQMVRALIVSLQTGAFAAIVGTLVGLLAAAFLTGTRLGRSGFSRSVVLRSEEHTSELQSLMRISYAVFCL